MKAIPLKNTREVAIIDNRDFRRVRGFKWSLMTTSDGNRYARASVNRFGQNTVILMHRLILKVPRKTLVDHKSGDGLDNRRQNLRPATDSQNQANRKPRVDGTGFKGVERNGNGFASRITVNRYRHYLGQFRRPEDAARAYDRAAAKFFGEFARLNFEERKALWP